ncbi:MAG: DUF1905 domain-containing protein [Flavobacteriales bacterium]|nr:DUF1905 domain-containing protein [Flavobacteriales bacterium]
MKTKVPEIEFEAMILDADNGMDAAFIKIPVDVNEVFGSGKPKVRAIFDNSVEYRGSLVKYGTPFHMLLLRKDVRTKLAKVIGEMLHVRIVLDTEERTVDVPKELEEALTSAPKLKAFFNQLSFSCRKEYATFIGEAKRPETRERRLNKVMIMLGEGKKSL